VVQINLLKTAVEREASAPSRSSMRCRQLLREVTGEPFIQCKGVPLCSVWACCEGQFKCWDRPPRIDCGLTRTKNSGTPYSTTLLSRVYNSTLGLCRSTVNVFSKKGKRPLFGFSKIHHSTTTVLSLWYDRKLSLSTARRVFPPPFHDGGEDCGERGPRTTKGLAINLDLTLKVHWSSWSPASPFMVQRLTSSVRKTQRQLNIFFRWSLISTKSIVINARNIAWIV